MKILQMHIEFIECNFCQQKHIYYSPAAPWLLLDTAAWTQSEATDFDADRFDAKQAPDCMVACASTKLCFEAMHACLVSMLNYR